MRILILVLAFTLFACTSSSNEEGPPKNDPKKEKLEKMLQALEKEFIAYDEKIKGSGTDMGLNNQLIEEKELLRSRIERVKENLKQYGGGQGAEKAAAHH